MCWSWLSWRRSLSRLGFSRRSLSRSWVGGFRGLSQASARARDSRRVTFVGDEVWWVATGVGSLVAGAGVTKTLLESLEGAQAVVLVAGEWSLLLFGLLGARAVLLAWWAFEASVTTESSVPIAAESLVATSEATVEVSFEALVEASVESAGCITSQHGEVESQAAADSCAKEAAAALGLGLDLDAGQ